MNNPHNQRSIVMENDTTITYAAVLTTPNGQRFEVNKELDLYGPLSDNTMMRYASSDRGKIEWRAAQIGADVWEFTTQAICTRTIREYPYKHSKSVADMTQSEPPYAQT